MSNVLLENASSGRVIITTDNPGCRETVVDGKTGYIYHGGDIEALIRTIEKFLELSNDVRMNMGIEGRKYVEQKFERKIVVDNYLKIIREFLV